MRAASGRVLGSTAASGKRLGLLAESWDCVVRFRLAIKDKPRRDRQIVLFLNLSPQHSGYPLTSFMRPSREKGWACHPLAKPGALRFILLVQNMAMQHASSRAENIIYLKQKMQTKTLHQGQLTLTPIFSASGCQEPVGYLRIILPVESGAVVPME